MTKSFVLFLALTASVSLASTGNAEGQETAYALTVTIVGPGTVTPGNGNYSDIINLEAIPEEGYKFAGWSHDLGGSINPMPLIMGSEKNVTASFVATDAPVHTVSTSIEGSGRILNFKDRALEGSAVEFYAIPDAGYIFAAWKGDTSGNANPVNLVIDADKDITAQFLPFSPATYYVSVDGDDSNPGTMEKPFQNIKKAFSLMKPGNVTYVMPGIYETDNNYLEGRSGESGNPMHIVAYDLNDKPVIKSGMTIVKCAYLHLKGLEFTNSSFKTYGPEAHHNIYENIDVHHVLNSGVAFNMNDRTHDNLLINCDFHENVLFAGSNADGIAMWGNRGNTDGPYNNTLIDCRSYFNNDDGFDIWFAGSNNRFEQCWAYGNGRDPDFNDIEGDGNGFKLGQGKCSAVLINCLAWKNRNTGFDQNSNTGGGLTILNCTAYDNSYHDVDFWEAPNTSVIRNCISYKGRVHTDAADDKFNSWNFNHITITDDDFVSLDFSANMGDRNPDGSLPESDFLKLKNGSQLIDAGIDVGLPYNGLAPDLGAFEYEADSATSVQAFEINSYGLQNYPNPFGEMTTICYALDKPSSVRLSIYNIKGEELVVLVDEFQLAGDYEINWNGASNSGEFIPRGIYPFKIQTDKDSGVRRMIKL